MEKKIKYVEVYYMDGSMDRLGNGAVDVKPESVVVKLPPQNDQRSASYIWSKEEDKILVDLYPIKTVPELCVSLPDKPAHAIYHRAGSLGIKKYVIHKKKQPGPPEKDKLASSGKQPESHPEKQPEVKKDKLSSSWEYDDEGFKDQKRYGSIDTEKNKLTSSLEDDVDEAPLVLTDGDPYDIWCLKEEDWLREKFFKLAESNTARLNKIVRDDLLPGKTRKEIHAKVKYMGMVLG